MNRTLIVLMTAVVVVLFVAELLVWTGTLGGWLADRGRIDVLPWKD